MRQIKKSKLLLFWLNGADVEVMWSYSFFLLLAIVFSLQNSWKLCLISEDYVNQVSKLIQVLV